MRMRRRMRRRRERKHTYLHGLHEVLVVDSSDVVIEQAHQHIPDLTTLRQVCNLGHDGPVPV